MSTIVYNMDCMEGMKEYPDKYFDLAIVDPPYGAGLGEGGGCGGWFAPYRENAGGGTSIGTDSERGSTAIVSRNGFHGKQYSQGSQDQERREMGERTKPQKNHFVGCAA